MFEIIPAIDLLDGKVVRLLQGDYQKQTQYSADPVQVAKEFEAQGAKRLHVVDLDGAKAGKPVNFQIIYQIAEQTGLSVDVGGGIRTENDVKYYLNAGIDFCVLGSVLLKDDCLASDLLELYGEKIIVGLDARNGMVSASGWTEDSQKPIVEMAIELEKSGAKQLIATDISKDGMMAGPSLELYQQLSHKTNLKIIASGGVSTVTDIQNLKKIPKVTGAIIGKALYEKNLDLRLLLSI